MNTEEKLMELAKEKLSEKEVGAIREIIEKNRFMEQDLKAKNDRLVVLLKESAELAEFRRKESVLVEKEAALKKSIEEYFQKKNAIDIEKARFEASVYKDTIDKLLKNTEIRKTYQKGIAVPSGSYVQSHQGYENSEEH